MADQEHGHVRDIACMILEGDAISPGDSLTGGYLKRSWSVFGSFAGGPRLWACSSASVP